jgi:PAP2 superfamily
MYAHSIRGAGLLVAATVLFALTVSAPARADTVTDWNAIATTAIVTTAGQSPQASTLSFAMVQGAVYDAVNAIDRGHQPYLVAPRAKRSDSKQAAAATAAFRVLAALFPSQLPTLQPFYDASLAAVPDGRRERGGIAAGAAAAAAMLAARANDGRNGPFTFPIGSEPGAWRPTPPTLALDPAPWVGNVRPFLVPSAEMIRSDPPNPLTSTAYAQDFNEVKQLGSLTSTARSADQTEAAIFWQDHGPALWNRVFAALSASHELNIAENARLFATENLAAADGAIGCWHSKYYWKFWRPITAIREAASDGNPATEADPAWTPLFDPATPQFGTPLVTPGFPDHPAGHGCISGAMVHTLQRFFGTDKIAFSAFSNRTRTTRSYDRLSQALKEIINARVWGGIHFRTADLQGALLGKKVAHWLAKHYFQPVR